MPITFEEAHELSPVEKFDAVVEWLIQSAIEEEAETSLSELVEMIREEALVMMRALEPPELGPQFAALRELRARQHERDRADEIALLERMVGAADPLSPKPRIRVRAATQHTV